MPLLSVRKIYRIRDRRTGKERQYMITIPREFAEGKQDIIIIYDRNVLIAIPEGVSSALRIYECLRDSIERPAGEDS